MHALLRRVAAGIHVQHHALLADDADIPAVIDVDRAERRREEGVGIVEFQRELGNRGDGLADVGGRRDALPGGLRQRAGSRPPKPAS
jgi:hypothetical protein